MDTQKKPRWRSRLLLLLSLGIAAIVATIFITNRQSPPVFSAPDHQGDSTSFQRTVIVPTLDTPSPKGKNVIWCASFQLAWNHLCDDVMKEPVKLNGAQEIADRLNKSELLEADLPEDSYYAVAGKGSDGIYTKIRNEMARRFPGYTPNLPSEKNASILAYAYLQAKVPFKYTYQDTSMDFTDSAGKKTGVDGFGVFKEFMPDKLRPQVQILYRNSENEIIIDPCKVSKPNQLILARIPPKETLAATVVEAERLISTQGLHGQAAELDACGFMNVPNVRFFLKHHYAEFEGTSCLNKAADGLSVTEARQDIRFQLDKTGARLKSEAEVVALAVPSFYYFDRPFLIMMKKRGALHPFFVMWVDNAELLCKSN